jgi:hypothetical protein
MYIGLPNLGLNSFAKRWSPSDLWPTGTEPGMWLDQQDGRTGYQDSTGVTLDYVVGAGSIDPPVGRRLDKRLGLVRGPDMVLNGGFASGTNWVAETEWVIGGGVAAYTFTTGTTHTLYQPLTIVAGKSYEVTFDVTAYSGFAEIAPTFSGADSGGYVSGVGPKRAILTAGAARTSLLFYVNALAGGSVSIDNVTMREIPGNHVLQATAAARPVWSGRYNMLVKTDDVSSVSWTKGATATTPNATTVNFPAVSDYINQTTTPGVVGVGYCASAVLSGSGTITIVPANFGADYQVTLTPTPTRYTTPVAAASSTVLGCWLFRRPGDTATQVTVTDWQVQPGAFTRYQRVVDANTYDTAGVPLFDKFDGVDDGYGTATFAAATLSSNMDCFIAIRRTSTALGTLVSMDSGGSGKYFCNFDSSGGSVSAGVGASTTYAVNGTAVPGGTGATAAQLNTALTVGSMVILEARNLDLSAWTALWTSLYTGRQVNGQIAELILCPAQTDAVRTQIRRYMAAHATQNQAVVV